jgi:hypothetical protein
MVLFPHLTPPYPPPPLVLGRRDSCLAVLSPWTEARILQSSQVSNSLFKNNMENSFSYRYQEKKSLKYYKRTCDENVTKYKIQKLSMDIII